MPRPRQVFPGRVLTVMLTEGQQGGRVGMVSRGTGQGPGEGPPISACLVFFWQLYWNDGVLESILERGVHRNFYTLQLFCSSKIIPKLILFKNSPQHSGLMEPMLKI